MDLEEEIDYYDLIKAPQYLDFNELVRNNGVLEEEDPADSFFASAGDDTVVDYEAFREEYEREEAEMSQNEVEYKDEQDAEDVQNLINKSMAKCGSPAPHDLSITHGLPVDLSMTQNSQAQESDMENMDAVGIKPNQVEELGGKFLGLTLDSISKVISELELDIQAAEAAETEDESETQKPNLNMSLEEPRVTPAEEGPLIVTKYNCVQGKQEPTGSKRQSAPKRLRSGSLPTLHKFKLPAMQLPKKVEMKVTIPKPFRLHETRTKPIMIQKEEPFKFKARRAPVKILHGGPTGFKEVAGPKPPTCPQSPHFASDDRIRERHIRANTPVRAESPNENNRPASACSSTASLHESRSKIPRPGSFRAPSPVVRADKKVTVAQPFSFEERDKEMRRARAEKVRQELESEAKVPEFHANPRPSFSRPKGVPKKKFVELTNVEPFNLKADQRGAMHQEALRKKLELAERQRQEQATFHANPPTVIFKKPFEPEPSQKPLACPIDLQLNSDKRAQEREQYDNYLKQKEEQHEQQKKQADIERAEHEKQVEIEKRKELVHKANPLKPFRAFQVRSSVRPLTTPMSPAFAPLPSQRRRILQQQSTLPEHQ